VNEEDVEAHCNKKQEERASGEFGDSN